MSGRSRRALILAHGTGGWHEARVADALRARGVESTIATLSDCALCIDDSDISLQIPGFSDTLPDGVLVRGFPAGSLEAITLRLDLLHALGELGVPVYNEARTIERTVDKAMTSLLLQRAGVPTPPSWVLQTREAALQRMEQEIRSGHELVLKPMFGSQGYGLIRLTVASQLPDAEDHAGVYYLQRFVSSRSATSRDWRVMVIGGQARAAMERRNDASWVTNRAQGSECLPAVLDAALSETAEAAAAAVGARFAGVDIIRGSFDEPLVLEVNGIPAWQGLQTVSDVDIAATLADDFLKLLPAPRLAIASPGA